MQLAGKSIGYGEIKPKNKIGINNGMISERVSSHYYLMGNFMRQYRRIFSVLDNLQKTVFQENTSQKQINSIDIWLFF